jgi:ketosteroid isomerase-like protein
MSPTGKSYRNRYTYREIPPETYCKLEISYREKVRPTGKSYRNRYTWRKILPEGYRKNRYKLPESVYKVPGK